MRGGGCEMWEPTRVDLKNVPDSFRRQIFRTRCVHWKLMGWNVPFRSGGQQLDKT